MWKSASDESGHHLSYLGKTTIATKNGVYTVQMKRDVLHSIKRESRYFEKSPLIDLMSSNL